MRYIYTFLVFLLILSSCSDWKYNKGIKWKQPEYHSSRIKPTEVKEDKTTVSVYKDEPIAESTESVQEEATVETKPTEEIINPETVLPDREEVTILMRDEDSTQKVSPEVVRMAFDAEERGRKSRIFGIIGLILTATYIFAFVGLVFSIIGLIKGINSLKSRYNTPEGVRMARTGLITSSIVVGLYVVAIVALIAMLILLL